MPIADYISKSDGRVTRNRCLAWGETGSGKTHFALTWPKPFVLDFEDQGPFLKDLGIPFISFPMLNDKGKRIRTYQAVFEALRLFIDNDESVRDIETIVIDSYTEFSYIVLREAVELPNLLQLITTKGSRNYVDISVDNVPSLDRVKPDRDIWGQVRSQLDSITKRTWWTGRHIIGTARVREEEDGSPQPDVISGFRGQICGQFHDVFFLRDRGKNWDLCTRKSAGYYAKARFKKERRIKDTYEDPSYQKIYHTQGVKG